MSTGSISVTPSRRVRTAEAMAQAMLGRVVPTGAVCAAVADLRARLGVDHAQLSIISDRQIAVVLDGRLARLNLADEDPYAPVVSPLENTLCAVAMRVDRLVRIDDTSLDDRVASTPPVVKGYIGSYVGSPIRMAPESSHEDAMPIGVLCVYNAADHVWTAEETRTLESAALEVARELKPVLEAVGATA